jgi:beta-barrel assembly-enhancing protease
MALAESRAGKEKTPKGGGLMNTGERLRARRLRALTFAGAALACQLHALQAAPPAETKGQPQDQESELGQSVFDELKAKGEIIESSPLYDVLLPVIEPIMRTAQPQYNHPFKVYLVHEAQPNAFATPGGNIYVTDALLYFVKSKEQLAGTLCHEVAHTIHHDSMELLKKQKLLRVEEVGAAILLGPTRAHVLAIALLGKLRSLGYSRGAESRADLTGSDVCAAAGSNPWGLVWLFRDFKDARTREIPQLLSDHPNDQNRVDALKKHFSSEPSVFGRFNPNPESATPLTVEKKTPVVFLR